MPSIIESIRAEYLRCKGLAEAAIDQLSEAELSAQGPNGGNSMGQIVYVAKSLRGKDWTFLSIPPGMSDTYNQAPSLERAASHQATLSGRSTRK